MKDDGRKTYTIDRKYFASTDEAGLVVTIWTTPLGDRELETCEFRGKDARDKARAWAHDRGARSLAARLGPN